jgi:hypothetical protein
MHDDNVCYDSIYSQYWGTDSVKYTNIFILKMEAEIHSETWVTNYRIMRYHNLEDLDVYILIPFKTKKFS